MKLLIHTISETIEIEPSIDINTNSIIEQLEEGNMILIDTKQGSLFIINCINVIGIEIINPPISNK